MPILFVSHVPELNCILRVVAQVSDPRSLRMEKPIAIDQGPLGRLLAGKVTYSGTTFGRVSHPVAYSEIKGPMDVNGLAMSPFGIRSVTLLIDDGRYRVPLPLYERIDFTRAFPWYPLTPRTAFGAMVPRPRNIWKMTDVQVEIVDGRGKITLLPDIPLTWR